MIDYRDWQIPLGRRFRALKLWFVIRSFGVEGLQRADPPARGAGPASSPAGSQADPRFELAAPVPLSLVCFRHRGGDAVNQQILDTLNASGKHLPDAHAAGRQADAPHVDRPDQHRAPPRRAGLES